MPKFAHVQFEIQKAWYPCTLWRSTHIGETWKWLWVQAQGLAQVAADELGLRITQWVVLVLQNTSVGLCLCLCLMCLCFRISLCACASACAWCACARDYFGGQRQGKAMVPAVKWWSILCRATYCKDGLRRVLYKVLSAPPRRSPLQGSAFPLLVPPRLTALPECQPPLHPQLLWNFVFCICI